MVEAYKASLEDHLIEGINYSPAPSAKYVINRRSATFYPSGSNIYKPDQGTKLIKLDVMADEWLDPLTVRIMFELKNDGTQNLYPLGSCHAFFRRMRLICKGQVVEDIDMYNRCHEMFEVLSAKHVRDNNMVDAFGARFDEYDPDADFSNTAGALTGTITNRTVIAADKSKYVSFQLLSGLLNQEKWLPLRFCGFTIELELVNSAREPVVNPEAATVAAATNTGFADENTSYSWSIQNVSLKADLCTLDPKFEEQIISHLASGETLNINYQTFINQSQVVGQGSEFSVNITRAVSALKALFVSFYNTNAGGNMPNATARPILKEFNYFYHPNAHDLTSTEKELEIQVQIGSKVFPEYPLKSVSEAWNQLKKALGLMYSTYHSISITPKQYRANRFIAAIDTEKIVSAALSGLSLRHGELVTVKCKRVFGEAELATVHMPDRLFFTMVSDNILSISISGVSVAD
jgi:hypothetical protein